MIVTMRSSSSAAFGIFVSRRLHRQIGESWIRGEAESRDGDAYR